MLRHEIDLCRHAALDVVVAGVGVAFES
jgi:hypothetical protein